MVEIMDLVPLVTALILVLCICAVGMQHDVHTAEQMETSGFR